MTARGASTITEDAAMSQHVFVFVPMFRPGLVFLIYLWPLCWVQVAVSYVVVSPALLYFRIVVVISDQSLALLTLTPYTSQDHMFLRSLVHKRYISMPSLMMVGGTFSPHHRFVAALFKGSQASSPEGSYFLPSSPRGAHIVLP